MNNTNLTLYRIPTEADAWFRFRTTGLLPEDCEKYKCNPYAGGCGSSEIGLLLGLQKKYRPSVQEVYHHKCGDLVPQRQSNRAMVRGKILEPIVAKIWMLYEGEDDSWVPNIMDYMEGNRELKRELSVRNARKYNAYFVNEKYPWLFSSLDYFAEKNTPGIMDGKIHPDGFPVEVKTINTHYAKLWVDGVPPTFVAQLNQEMICTNSDYGELAVLFPDEFKFTIFPFYRDQELCDRIIHWSKKFWDKVLESREAKKKMDFYFQAGKLQEGEEQQAIIDSNEPEPDDGEAYLEYIKERFQPGFNEEIDGDLSLYDDTMVYKLCAGISGLLDEKQTGIKNRILKLLTDTGATKISFGEAGQITFNENKNKQRTLLINTKALYDIKGITQTEFDKLDFTIKR